MSNSAWDYNVAIYIYKFKQMIFDKIISVSHSEFDETNKFCEYCYDNLLK